MRRFLPDDYEDGTDWEKIKEDWEKMRPYRAEDFGYEGNVKLMNRMTGSVDTAANWASEANDWIGDKESIVEQFSSLVHVRKIKGEWIEVKS